MLGDGRQRAVQSGEVARAQQSEEEGGKGVRSIITTIPSSRRAPWRRRQTVTEVEIAGGELELGGAA